MEQLQAQAIGFVQIVAGGLISLAGIYATIYINKAIAVAKAKAASIKDEQAKALVNNTLDGIDNLINTNIVSAENTLKPTILQAIADGKVDKSELSSIAVVVKENVLKQLGEQTIEVFNKNLGDINSYVENRIEKNLADLKEQPGNTVNKTVIPDVSSNTTTTVEASTTTDAATA